MLNMYPKSMKKFLKNTSGNIALLAALLIPTTMVLVGGGMDFSMLHTSRMNLERAADAAVTASVSTIRANADTLSPDEIPVKMKEVAQRVFEAEKGVLGINTEVTFDAEVTYENQVLTTRLNYELEQDTTFLKLIGKENIKTSGVAEAKSSLGSYTDFNILVNVSNSMGVGASQEDIDYMMANYRYNGKACAFACHNTINYIRTLPVKIRLDAAVESIDVALNTVKNSIHKDSEVRFGLYKYATEFHKVFDTSHDNATDLNWISQQVEDNIQLSTEDNSRMDYAVGKLTDELGVSGQGITEDAPKKFALIITDGVQWIRPRYPEYDRRVIGAEFHWSRAQIPNEAACDGLKQNGVEVYFIYTTYIPNYGSTVQDLVRRIDQNVLPVNKQAMMNCASEPENFFEAKDADALTEAMTQIFKEVTIPTHLSM